MLGKAPAQMALFSTENSYKDKLKATSFHRFFAERRHEIFRDEDYAVLYCSNNGRTSVPPSILATACILQGYHRTSDEETVQRATYDVRWCVALGTELAEQPFAKSTLQEFRAKLLLNDQVRQLFQRSLAYAQEKGYLKNRKMRVAMDTTHILGKGAVKDTYNLLADGIKKLYTGLKRQKASGLLAKDKEHFARYFGKSFKGDADIDWDDPVARQQLLQTLADDARALLRLTQETISAGTLDQEQVNTLREAAMLLSQLLLQDLETDADQQAHIKQGVSPDRIVSTTDPDMRHGRKSARSRFDGHKAAVATDLDSQLITAVDVVSGNTHDGDTAVALVEQSQENTGNAVETAFGDCAFGTAEVREQFEHRDTELVAKVPKSPSGTYFTKHDFTIDLDNKKVTCPHGQSTTTYRTVSVWFGKKKQKRSALRFVFPQAVCAACPLRDKCIRSTAPQGKIIQLHPREDLLQKARQTAATPHFKEQYRERTTVEHSIARLVQRGIRKSRFFGTKRTRWQVALAAAVVNFMLIAAREAARAEKIWRFLPKIWRRLKQIAERSRVTPDWPAVSSAIA